jgi:hypothetical protein
MAAVCAVMVEGNCGGASYGAVWGVGDEAAVCVGALQMLVAHVVDDKKALGEGVDAVVRLDGGEGGGGGELVVKTLAWHRPSKAWVVAKDDCIKLQVSGGAALLRGRSHHRIRCVCMRAQVDGRVGFEAAVSAVTGELRAGVAGERDATAGLRRAIVVLRGEVARRCEVTAAALAERDAALAELAALQRQVAEDAPATALGREEARRRAEVAAAVAVASVADAIARKVATPLTTAAASAYLRACGFPADAQPAGITWGINSVPAGCLTASSAYHDDNSAHPGCRLLYSSNAVASKHCFLTSYPFAPGEWVCVDLGSERSVVGALVQTNESTERCDESEACWFRHKFRWSADGAVWTDVDGGHEWTRDGLARKDVAVCVFGAPVRCRFLRIVAVSKSGCLRWEVVVLP